MPTPLVSDVRARLREEARPLRAGERAQLLATLHAVGVDPDTTDPVSEFEDALTAMRVALIRGSADPATVAAVHRLLSAGRVFMADEPPVERVVLPPAPVMRYRADIDG